MATLDTILDLELEAETVWKNFLSAAPYSLGAVQSDSAVAVTTPRVEVVATVLRMGPHQYQITGGTYAGRRLYDQIGMRLTLEVVYQPEHAQGPGAIRAKVRRALSDWAGLKAAYAVNGYQLPAPDTIQQTDGDRTTDDEEKTETLRTVVELVAFLNPAALNSAT